jgi:enoyl-CoA hydratase/carnithine racemase
MAASPSQPSSDDVVLSERLGTTALLTLNRPQALNALTPAMEARYLELLNEAEADPAVRVVVVTGAGRGFCAGTELGGFDPYHDEHVPARERARPLWLRKPLIAAINGGCAGMGFVHAMYCDVRFCADDAKITTAFARRGIVAENGLSWLLPRITGLSTALDLLLSGRVVLGAEALSLGIVDRVLSRADLLNATLRYADDIGLHCSPEALADIKQMTLRHLHVPLDVALDESQAALERALERPDAREGLTSFLERREPSFAPLSSKDDVTGGRTGLANVVNPQSWM